MKPLKQDGFTIIETMLFLGISGLLVMGILVGTGTSINVQRYRDSVTSLRAHLQQQYSDVANVSNGSTSNTCGGSPSPRGQSNCVILGKYITSSDSRTITVKNVIGTIPSTDPGTDDVNVLRAYNIQVSSASTQTYEVEWGSSMDHKDNTSMSFSMLILRSPSSGLIRTFINNQTSIPDLQVNTRLLVATALNNDATVCLDSNGLLTGSKLAVYVEKNAASSSGVTLLGDDSGCN